MNPQHQLSLPVYFSCSLSLARVGAKNGGSLSSSEKAKGLFGGPHVTVPLSTLQRPSEGNFGSIQWISLVCNANCMFLVISSNPSFPSKMRPSYWLYHHHLQNLSAVSFLLGRRFCHYVNLGTLLCSRQASVRVNAHCGTDTGSHEANEAFLRGVCSIK